MTLIDTSLPDGGQLAMPARPPRLTQAVAAVSVAVTGAGIDLPQGLTAGLLVALALLPVWAPVAWASGGMRLVAVFSGIALVSGLWLTELARGDHATSTGLALSTSLEVIAIVAGLGLLLWAREVLGAGGLALLFGAGLLLGISTTSALYESNPWRFGFSVPITVLVLALAARAGRPWLGLVAALVFAGLSVVTDARSSFSILLLTALAAGWQLWPRRGGRRPSWVAVVLSILGGAVVIYNFGQSLILDGVLGEATRARSLAQIETSGSLLLGGRPEIAATAALMADRPLGFGSGTVPTLSDILVAKTGMAAINYQPNNNYVENYLFGGRFELHSIVGDLWAHFGIPGIALSAVLIVVILRAVALRIAERAASALVVYLGVKSLWNMLFSPLQTSALLLILLLAIALPDRRKPS